MHRREFLKSALIVPATVGGLSGAALAAGGSPNAAQPASNSLSLAYWSGDRAHMIAADPVVKPISDVSPLLSLPGRWFATQLRDLNLAGTARDGAPDGVIAGADFAGLQTDATAVHALAGLTVNAQLGETEIVAWLLETSAMDVWAQIVSAEGWFPVAIGVGTPSQSLLAVGTNVQTDIAAEGLSRLALASDGDVQSSAILRASDSIPTSVGMDAASVVAAYGEAAAAPDTTAWRAVDLGDVTATGPLIAAFFDIDWWHAQTAQTQRTIKTIGEAAVQRSLAQQRMARHFVHLSRPNLTTAAPPALPDDVAVVRRIQACSTVCHDMVRRSPAASAIVGPLVELSRSLRGRYPSV